MKKMLDELLKPCPFCGGKATEAVIEDWNKRVDGEAKDE